MNTNQKFSFTFPCATKATNKPLPTNHKSNPSHSHTFTPSHFHTFTPSHLHTLNFNFPIPVLIGFSTTVNSKSTSTFVRSKSFAISPPSSRFFIVTYSVAFPGSVCPICT